MLQRAAETTIPEPLSRAVEVSPYTQLDSAVSSWGLTARVEAQLSLSTPQNSKTFRSNSKTLRHAIELYRAIE